MTKKFFYTYVASLMLVFGFSTINFAQSSPSEFPNVKIGNFGQMDERFYRGAQPLPEDYQALKDLGINTIVDLRNDPTDYAKGAVEALGMKYVNIPMSGWKYPKDEHINEFKRLMNDPETGVMYVHCKAGKHRTGVAGAVYRYENYGWNWDRVFEEMNNYNFTWWIVHGRLKTFAKDYGREIIKRERQLAAAEKSAAAEKLAAQAGSN